MDDDDDPSKLAWIWVIETLSSFKEITTSNLQGLIDAATVGPDDFSENTRELVALRCLEELSSYAKKVEPDASSNLDSRIGFDFSRSCEDVLQEILGEIPLSKLKVAGAELLKWDIYSFIKHKRAGTIKCHLQQLKESILEGTHPHADYLKERSGLFPRNSGYTVHVNDDKCDDHSEKDDGNSTDAENMGEEEKSVSLILEDGNKSSKDHLLDNKRNKVYSTGDHLMGHLPEKQVCINESDDFLRNSKRIKCYASTSFESEKEKPVSQLGREVSETSTERILLISEEVVNDTEKNDRVTLGDESLEESHNRCTGSNLRQSIGHNEVFREESNIPFDATLMAHHTFGGENSHQQQMESIPTNVALSDGIQHDISGSKPCYKHETDLQLKDPNGYQQTVATVTAPNDTGNSCRVEITDDMFVCQGEKINHLMEMHEEQNLGMNCSEGGQLLACDVTTVPSVPESCLNMTTTFISLNTSGVGHCENTITHETTDNVHHVEPISTNDNTGKVQPVINESQPNLKEPNVASLNFCHEPLASNKAVVDTVNDCGVESSSDSDGYHNEKNDLAAKKHEFMNSHCTFGQDFSAMNESTELNLCMKCNEGGQLLACKTTTCPFVVHKNCLGASAQLDENGNFVCPFCAYSHTISEYLEAKKKASMARKQLAIFISKGIRMHATELVHEFHRQDQSLSKKSSSKCEHVYVKNTGDDQLTGCEDNREVHVGDHANEANNLQSERSQQQAPISHVHLSCREKENVNNGLLEVLRDEEKGEMPNAKSLNGGRLAEMEVLTDPVEGHDDDKFACEMTNIVSANQSNAGEEVPQEMTTHDMKGTLEPVCAHDSGQEMIFEDECQKHVISRYSIRMRKHETKYKPQASPQLRRKKIPWTVEEEELIREGMQKFGCNDSKIPWKKILAFGAHVFEKDDKCRTPMDLKDKWKNMCKVQSKSK